ncbi:MAG: hypothetical protein FWD60_12345 [Candidatus Azobacteroides sp.]|nr:hypothetical protein [Candidatus Azobacteroides sp.]
MKTFFIWMIAGLSVCMSVSAQGYGGRGGFGGGGRGGYGGGGYRGNRGGNPGMRSQSQSLSKDYSQLCITDFPEITGLTLKQNLDLSTIITDEHRNLLKLSDQKQDLQVKIDHANSQKDIDKNTKKMANLNEKIRQVSIKADKKIQTILTNDQYKEFLEKKDQIKFGMLPTFRGGFRPNPNQPDNSNPERTEQPEE